MARVVLDNLAKTFRGAGGEAIRAVAGVSLSVDDGELLTLAGPTGCGKTTLLRLIAGLETPSAGRVLLDGVDAAGSSPMARDVAMVFQHHALYPHLTAYENMALGLKLRRHPKAEIKERVREAAEWLGLMDCLDRPPGALSGGQRQRVALARAVVRRPRLFLLDEPLSHLDAPMRRQTRAEIARLHRRLRATMICVTHDQSEAMMLGDRLAVMREGALHQVDKPLMVYDAPANIFVAGFLGSPPMNFFRGVIELRDGTLWFCADNPAAPPPASLAFKVRMGESTGAKAGLWLNRPVVLGLRPEHILPGNSAPDGSRDATVEAIVESIEVTGPEMWTRFAAGAHLFVARFRTGDEMTIGQPLALIFNMQHARFFEPATGEAIG
jgi:multiple sugar transport system ATP-binding protein